MVIRAIFAGFYNFPAFMPFLSVPHKNVKSGFYCIGCCLFVCFLRTLCPVDTVYIVLVPYSAKMSGVPTKFDVNTLFVMVISQTVFSV